MFFAVAVVSLAYQVWAVWRLKPARRTTAVKSILGVSLTLNVMLIAGWIVIAIRYR